MAETAATDMGYGPEVLGFAGARKGLDMMNNAKILLIHYVIKDERLQLEEYHLHK